MCSSFVMCIMCQFLSLICSCTSDIVIVGDVGLKSLSIVRRMKIHIVLQDGLYPFVCGCLLWFKYFTGRLNPVIAVSVGQSDDTLTGPVGLLYKDCRCQD